MVMHDFSSSPQPLSVMKCTSKELPNKLDLLFFSPAVTDNCRDFFCKMVCILFFNLFHRYDQMSLKHMLPSPTSLHPNSIL